MAVIRLGELTEARLHRTVLCLAGSTAESTKTSEIISTFSWLKWDFRTPSSVRSATKGNSLDA